MTTEVQGQERASVVPERKARVARVSRRPAPYRVAGAELFNILDAIAAKEGLELAVHAAQAMVQQAEAGLMTGDAYKRRAYDGTCVTCAVGTLAVACGYEVGFFSPSLPGWHEGQYAERAYTPIERWVWDVRRGDTRATNERLALLCGWCEQWILSRTAQ